LTIELDLRLVSRWVEHFVANTEGAPAGRATLGLVAQVDPTESLRDKPERDDGNDHADEQK